MGQSLSLLSLFCTCPGRRRADLAPEFLEGLQQYSHCWVLYVFHMNTGRWVAGLRGRGEGEARERAWPWLATNEKMV